MRNVMLVVGLAAVVGCGGISKEQYGAKEAEAAKYKQAAQEEGAKSAALESQVKQLEQQNESLQTQAGDLEKQVADAGAAQARLKDSQEKQLKELHGQAPLRVNQQLLFPENSSKLSPESKRALDSIADALAQLKDKSVLVAGYTDDSEAAGKDAKTKRWQLSSARALEVAKYLTGRGLDPTRIAVAGFGEARPAAPNDSLASRALNRRAEIALTPTDMKLGTVDVEPAELKGQTGSGR